MGFLMCVAKITLGLGSHWKLSRATFCRRRRHSDAVWKYKAMKTIHISHTLRRPTLLYIMSCEFSVTGLPIIFLKFGHLDFQAPSRKSTSEKFGKSVCYFTFTPPISRAPNSNNGILSKYHSRARVSAEQPLHPIKIATLWYGSYSYSHYGARY